MRKGKVHQDTTRAIADAVEVDFAAPKGAQTESWVNRISSIVAAAAAQEVVAGVRDATVEQVNREGDEA
jgi:hypothetical protein